MGCDIHPEVQVRRGGKWEIVPLSESPGKADRHGGFWPLLKNRNYPLFSALAGVRGGLEPIADPRGIPPDNHVLPGARGYQNDQDDPRYGDHSFSWLSLTELLAYDWAAVPVDEIGEAFPGDVLPWIKSLVPTGGTTDDVRLVFGFDS